MGVFLTIGGVASYALAVYAWFGMKTDIQLGIVVTAAIGGTILIGLGSIAEGLSRLQGRGTDR